MPAKSKIRKPSPPFLACSADASKSRWQILGLPYDLTSSYRGGSRYGPAEIRIASDSIESYSVYLQGELEDLGMADAGDLEIETLPSEEMVKAVSAYYKEQTAREKRIFALGGEHSVTVGAVGGIVEAGVTPYILQMDAHLDLREAYNRDKYTHCSVARRLAEIVGADHLIQWGMRSGERGEFEWARLHDSYLGRDPDAFCTICNRLRGEPIYLTLDVDLFDPGEMPGVGNPEPGGLCFSEFLILLDEIAPLNVVGADVVELSPVWDSSGRSAVMTAEIIRELLLTVAS